MKEDDWLFMIPNCLEVSHCLNSLSGKPGQGQVGVNPKFIPPAVQVALADPKVLADLFDRFVGVIGQLDRLCFKLWRVRSSCFCTSVLVLVEFIAYLTV